MTDEESREYSGRTEYKKLRKIKMKLKQQVKRIQPMTQMIIKKNVDIQHYTKASL